MSRPLQRYIDILEIAKNPFIGQDAVRMLLGDYIGMGAYRTVYSCPLIRGTVVKVSTSRDMANEIEFAVWLDVKGQPYAKWFAPCIEISACGYFLIQKRTRPMGTKDKFPKYLPQFFTDLKRENWGFIGKQLVCHDYQFLSRTISYSMQAKRATNVK